MDDGDPVVKAPLLLVQEWITHIPAEPDLLPRLKGIWSAARDKYSCATKWLMARGPISSLLAILSDLGWHAYGPDVWGSPDGCHTRNPLQAERGRLQKRKNKNVCFIAFIVVLV
jgi:hypothetical protein